MVYSLFSIIDRVPYERMDKVLSKVRDRLQIAAFTADDKKKPTRTARHRYQRPADFQRQIDAHRHHLQQQHQSNAEAVRAKYAKLLSDTLAMHNYYRTRHAAAPLTVSQRLNYIAQAYAEHLATTSTFEHSGNRLENEILGENLYMQWISKGRVPVCAKTAVKSWYDEIKLYSFKRPQYSEETGHFTQLIWKSTTKMGMGVAVSSDGREVYFVVNYYPAGNIINDGYFEMNVLAAHS